MIYFDLMDVFLANVCRIPLANIIEIDEITEHLPLIANEYPWQNNPCKGTIDAVTNCLGPDFPDCVVYFLWEGEDLPNCSDLQYWYFNDWVDFCAEDSGRAFECYSEVEAAKECVDYCTDAGDILGL